MKKILVLGAGKSATDLIHYLLKHAAGYGWEVTVADRDLQAVRQKVAGYANTNAARFDVADQGLRQSLVQAHDVVASVLPAQFHDQVAGDCLRFGKHMITPSYTSPRQKSMSPDFSKSGLLLMTEAGLDPGIDHMTLMRTLNGLKGKGADILQVKSGCGALVAPECLRENPWKYKFTWAPINVVKAGQGTAQYLKGGAVKYIPYNSLFAQTDSYELPGIGRFEAYANRNSLPYIDMYGLQSVPSFVRSTLRHAGFCQAWNAFVKLGWTSDDFVVPNAGQLTYAGFLEAFLPPSTGGATASLRHRLAHFLGVPPDGETVQKLEWLGIFDGRPIRLESASPAHILLDLLEEKWQLQPTDRDLVVMIHEITYRLGGETRTLVSSLADMGEDASNTALSKLVGLPMAIIVKLLLAGKLNLAGTQLPIMPQVYEPVLEELERDYGVRFGESDGKAHA